MVSKKFKKRLFFILCGYGSFKLTDLYFSNHRNETINYILSKIPFNIRVSNIEGGIFWGREIVLQNVQISDSVGNFNIEIDKIKAKTSILGLIYPNLFLKNLDITRASGKCQFFPTKFAFWLCSLRNIKLQDINIRFGDNENNFLFELDHANTKKYGLSAVNLFSQIDAKGKIDSQPFSFVTVNSDKKSAEVSFPFLEDIEKNKNKFVTLEAVPEYIKYIVHFGLSSVLITHPRMIEFSISTKTILNILLFFNVPFVFDSNLPIDSKVNFSSYLKPGRNYHLKAKASWSNFSFPRVVSLNYPRNDQFYLFLKKFFDAHPNSNYRVEVYYDVRQYIKSDKSDQLEAFCKILDSIFSVSIDEIFGE